MLPLARYLKPPCTIFDERLDVPQAKSCCSTSRHFKPRLAVSNKTPAPVMPPPTTTMSQGDWELVSADIVVWRWPLCQWFVAVFIIYSNCFIWAFATPRALTKRPYENHACSIATQQSIPRHFCLLGGRLQSAPTKNHACSIATQQSIPRHFCLLCGRLQSAPKKNHAKL